MLERVGDFQADRDLRHQLGDAIHFIERIIERAPYVANCGAGEQSSEGDDLGHSVPAIAFDYVLDHFVAPIVREIHVDVGHLDAFGVQEPLERLAVLHRIQVRNAQAEQDDAASG